MRKNKNLTGKRNLVGWLIFFLIIILIAISSLLIINIMKKQSVNKVKSYEKEYSVQDNTQDSSTQTKRSNYGVNFNGISESSGNYGTLKFNLSNTKTDEIKLSYDSPNFSEQQIAFLTPKKIETKILKVNANSEVKEVNTNTELKLANVSNSVTKEFFYPFNGNDTKIYAYYMKNGDIALAFQPSEADQYQVIEFRENSTIEQKNAAPTFEEAVQIMKNRDKNPDIVYADFGTSSDSKGEFRKVKAISSTAREGGGTGTLGFVDVYQDGEVVEGESGNFDSN